MTSKEVAIIASNAAKKKNEQLVAERRKAALLKVSEEEFRDYYMRHTQEETCNNFSLAKWEFFYIRDFYKIKKTRKQVTALIQERGVRSVDKDRRKQHIVEKYGSWDAYRESISTKVKGTKQHRYGDANYNNPDKNKETLIKHYGSLELANNSRVETMKLTIIERYGSMEDYNKIRAQKMKETNRSRYGVDCSLWAEDVEPRIRKTFIDKYGVPYYCMTSECRAASRNNSSINKAFEDFIVSSSIEYDREFAIENKSYDFRIGNNVIELNPVPTHNSTWTPFGNHEGIPEDYHYNKSILAESYGYRCIHVWDWDDWSKVLLLVTSGRILYARKTVVKEIDSKVAQEFISTYHIQGGCRGSNFNVGLYYNNELVSVMTFGNPRYSTKEEWELIRFCSKVGIVGGAEKMFSYFISSKNPRSIVSYCDRSKFTGRVYTRLGFVSSATALPSCHWYNLKNGRHITDNLLRQHGFDQLHGTSYGKGTSNEQLMLDSGYVKIFDCGQQKFIWNS